MKTADSILKSERIGREMFEPRTVNRLNGDFFDQLRSRRSAAHSLSGRVRTLIESVAPYMGVEWGSAACLSASESEDEELRYNRRVLRELNRYRFELVKERLSCQNRALSILKEAGLDNESIRCFCDIMGITGKEDTLNQPEAVTADIQSIKALVDRFLLNSRAAIPPAARLTLSLLCSRIRMPGLSLVQIEAEIKLLSSFCKDTVKRIHHRLGVPLHFAESIVYEAGEMLFSFDSAHRFISWSGIHRVAGRRNRKRSSARTNSFFREILSDCVWTMAVSRKQNPIVLEYMPKALCAGKAAALEDAQHNLLTDIFYILKLHSRIEGFRPPQKSGH